MITKQQAKAIESIKKVAETMHGEKHADKYEIKKFEIDECEYFVSLTVEVGLKGDEGTMAEILCRDYAHLFIGKRGGITYPVCKKMKNGSYKHYTKCFGGYTAYNLYQAVIDQR